MPAAPNIILILADDLGFSDLGCYGGEIRTPHLDRLAGTGCTMSSFYSTARCSPSRASLLTGLHPHQTGIGILTGDTLPAGYPGDLDSRCLTVAEMLRAHGYRTSAIGKWHLARDVRTPNHVWPTRSGFERFWGPLGGACSYFAPTTMVADETPVEIDEPDFYLTEELAHRAVREVIDASADGRPFFLYLPFTAPHWPLHARPETIDSYRGAYDRGWDAVRRDRLRSLERRGVFEGQRPALSDRDSDVPPWDDVADKAWQARRMQTYAAQVTAMDDAVGQVLDTVELTGNRENTLVLFLSDNGGCAEEIPAGWADEMAPVPYNLPPRAPDGARVKKGNAPWVEPGLPDSFASYGRPWANVSNTPFREYKHWVHEGGIATPLIASWPAGGLRAGWNHTPYQLTDVLPTVLDAVGLPEPSGLPSPVGPGPEGRSMLAAWRGDVPSTDHTLYFEHEGHGAVRAGPWKCVRRHGRPWELYDLSGDRTETVDLAAQRPDLVEVLTARWHRWADRCGVRERKAIMDQRPSGSPGGLIQDVSSTSHLRGTSPAAHGSCEGTA